MDRFVADPRHQAMNLPRMERVPALAWGRGTEIATNDYGLTYSRKIMLAR